MHPVQVMLAGKFELLISPNIAMIELMALLGERGFPRKV